MAGAWRELFQANPILRQGLPVLLLTAVGSLLTGVVFERMTPLLRGLPGLIVLVPPLIGLRGNINTALGSRLGSAIHLGVVESGSLWDDEIRENVLGSLALSIMMPFLAALLAFVATLLLGLPTIPFRQLVVIAVVAGFASGVFLAAITLGIMRLAHRYGLDPDNVTGPGLATVGDVITLSVLASVAVLVGGWL